MMSHVPFQSLATFVTQLISLRLAEPQKTRECIGGCNKEPITENPKPRCRTEPKAASGWVRCLKEHNIEKEMNLAITPWDFRFCCTFIWHLFHVRFTCFTCFTLFRKCLRFVPHWFRMCFTFVSHMFYWEIWAVAPFDLWLHLQLNFFHQGWKVRLSQRTRCLHQCPHLLRSLLDHRRDRGVPGARKKPIARKSKATVPNWAQSSFWLSQLFEKT